MAVDTDTSDRLREVEKRLYDLQAELQREHNCRENTITWIIAWAPIIAIWIVVISAAIARSE
jgi:hypothetical protein